MKLKIIHVVGNRPQFIKLGPFLGASKHVKKIDNIVVNSGQHYDYEMAALFFKDMGIEEIAYSLEVGSGSHGYQTGSILLKLDAVFNEVSPDAVVVYGDTNTTLAGALAAYKWHIPLAHVEAGMREWIWRPEEINKKMADHCADLCFCPMDVAVRNLRKEGVSEDKIFFTGDITFDAYLRGCEIVSARDNPDLPNEDYVVMTMHRAETVDNRERLGSVLKALQWIQKQILVLLPIHPRTHKMIRKYGLNEHLRSMRNVKVMKPIGYLDFIWYENNATFVITDSGGVQKEAFYAKKPCLILDRTTEYFQLSDLGANIMAGCSDVSIVEGFTKLDQIDFNNIDQELFGDGHAAEKMVDILLRRLS
jgi:UDP-GlcNAc3NAcA epimerase